MAALLVVGYEAKRLPRYEQQGIVHIAESVRSLLGHGIEAELAVLINQRFGSVGARQQMPRREIWYRTLARMIRYEDRPVLALEVKGRSKKEVQEQVARVLEFLDAVYREEILSMQQRQEERRRKILDEMAEIQKQIQDIEEGILSLEGLMPRSKAAIELVSNLTGRLWSKEERRAFLQKELRLLESARHEKTFRFVVSRSSAIPIAYGWILKRGILSMLFAVTVLLCILIVRDVWRIEGSDAG